MARGTTQAVAVNTPGVEGAVCELTSRRFGIQTVRAPGHVTLPKSRHDVQVRCCKPCHEDGVGVIPSRMAGATAGNVLLGGGVGLVVDAASGAMHRYTPQVDVAMRPIPGCRKTAMRGNGWRQVVLPCGLRVATAGSENDLPISHAAEGLSRLRRSVRVSHRVARWDGELA